MFIVPFSFIKIFVFFFEDFMSFLLRLFSFLSLSALHICLVIFLSKSFYSLINPFLSITRLLSFSHRVCMSLLVSVFYPLFYSVFIFHSLSIYLSDLIYFRILTQLNRCLRSPRNDEKIKSGKAAQFPSVVL